MRTLDFHHLRHALGGARLGATGAPISLLLLPKCPLCLTPLIASVGIVMAPSKAMLYVLGGILVMAWLSVVLVLGRRQPPLIRIGALVLALVSGLAIAAESRVLLWSATLAMAAAGVAVSRACTTSANAAAEPCGRADVA
jgi:hypothetical protein